MEANKWIKVKVTPLNEKLVSIKFKNGHIGKGSYIKNNWVFDTEEMPKEFSIPVEWKQIL